MHRATAGVGRVASPIRSFGPSLAPSSGVNEARLPRAKVRAAPPQMRASMSGLHAGMKHAWVVSVTALAGQRRAG